MPDQETIETNTTAADTIPPFLIAAHQGDTRNFLLISALKWAESRYCYGKSKSREMVYWNC